MNKNPLPKEASYRSRAILKPSRLAELELDFSTVSKRPVDGYPQYGVLCTKSIAILVRPRGFVQWRMCYGERWLFDLLRSLFMSVGIGRVCECSFEYVLCDGWIMFFLLNKLCKMFFWKLWNDWRFRDKYEIIVYDCDFNVWILSVFFLLLLHDNLLS